MNTGIYVGFELSGNGRFLLDDYVITHNTTVMRELEDISEEGSVVFTAFTNTAAKVLRAKIKPSETMHTTIRTLECQSEEYLERITAMVIDESSMVDEVLFSRFIEASVILCPNLCRLVLVGDVHQLECMGIGSLLETMSARFPVVYLKKSHRVNDDSRIISDNAEKIRNKDHSIKTDDNAFKMVIPSGNMMTDFTHIFGTNPSLNINNTHVLAPRRCEVEMTRKIVKEIWFKDTSDRYSVGDRIISNQNVRSLNICNGDYYIIRNMTVMCRKRDTNNEINDSIVCDIRDTSDHVFKYGEFVQLDLEEAVFTDAHNPDRQNVIVNVEGPVYQNMNKMFSLGYCTTNHKFQGSEADNIIWVMTDVNYFVDYKSTYTAVTRAKKRVIVLGTQDDLKKSISYTRRPKRSLLNRYLDRDQEGYDRFELNCRSRTRLEYLMKSIEDTIDNGETRNNKRK
jgi:exodeoxyribonuclease V alpha subunit